MKNERKKRVAHSVDDVVIKENVANSNYSDEEKVSLEVFANRLNEELQIKNISQEELAKVIHVSTGALSNYRTGSRFPEARILVALSEKLDVSLDYLFGITDLKSTDVEFKRINDITGLTDDAINNLKEYVDFLNDDNSLSTIKSIPKNKLNAINYLIANEEKANIFYTIASFLWLDYETNYEDVIYKGLDKNKIYKPDLEENRKIYENLLLFNVKGQDTFKSINLKDADRIDLLLLEEQLSNLKKQCKNEQK